jgi:uncharacterized protein
MKIVLTGASGYLGQKLAKHYSSAGHDTTVISRKPNVQAAWHNVEWDGKTIGPWAGVLEGADAVINLAGRSVNCRYNEANKAEIYASRLDSTRVLGEAIGACDRPPRVWLNSSSATIYRHAEDRPMDEATGEIGSGFSVDVCQKWERKLADALTPNTRKVAMRTAMVMGPGKGGPFEAFYRLVRLRLGGAMAGGRQFVSWLHVDDFCRSTEWLIAHDDLDGAVNIASPNPLTNREFMRTLREVAGVGIGLPAARWMLEIGTRLMGTETELVVKSRRVVPARLLQSGFEFRFPEWREAAKDIVAKWNP